MQTSHTSFSSTRWWDKLPQWGQSIASVCWPSKWRQRRCDASLALAQLQHYGAVLTPAEIQYWCRCIQRHHCCLEILPLAQHRNGYLRAAALHRLAQQPQATHIYAICARFNDWVPEVRLAAQVAMRSHLRPPFFAAWLACWPQIRALYHCQRSEHRLLVMEIEQFMLRNGANGPAHAHLCDALYAPQRALAREACRLVAHAELIPQTELIAYALQSCDRQIAGCAPAWIAQLPRAEQNIWLQQGLRAPLRQVRNACRKMLLR